jgi:alpha/beta superfamily hydrolase
MMESVSFYSGGRKILGNIHLPFEGAPCIITLHGLEGDKDSDKWLAIASRLYREGYACLRFNFRGCGEGLEKSEGEFEDTCLTARIEDYRAALRFLESTGKVNLEKLGVVGSSFGGMVAIAAGEKRVRAMVTLASPYKIPWSEDSKILMEEAGYVRLPSGRRLKKSFFEDLKDYDILRLVGNVPPILVIHGGLDELVPVEHAYRLYEAASTPKRIEIVENADHVFSKGLDKALALILEWFKKFLV